MEMMRTGLLPWPMSEILTASIKLGRDACMTSSTMSAMGMNLKRGYEDVGINDARLRDWAYVSGLMRCQTVLGNALSRSTFPGLGGENFIWIRRINNRNPSRERKSHAFSARTYSMKVHTNPL